MSWSRFGCEGSDLYTFPSERDGIGTIECCMCPLMESGSFTTIAIEPFVTHLQHHRAAGHNIPEYLEPLIIEEAPEYLGPVEPSRL